MFCKVVLAPQDGPIPPSSLLEQHDLIGKVLPLLREGKKGNIESGYRCWQKQKASAQKWILNMLGCKREVISQKRGEFVAMEHALELTIPAGHLQPVLIYVV